MDRLNVSRTGIARVARSTKRKIARNKAAHFSALLRGGSGLASQRFDDARANACHGKHSALRKMRAPFGAHLAFFDAHLAFSSPCMWNCGAPS
ncbi:MAG TPA: hypothetical protein VJU59_35390 [Paraburkholderia sp.]|uniref:hypothetical protein n=1 Tax=Paraburkholderia sp. TaxID=1926495 RepID=UPI002B46EACF|nr:hypothetical protein [Paraburkholderia sp.]HKR44897.1 hypothetical protein [Paraburkholderia sp.]